MTKRSTFFWILPLSILIAGTVAADERDNAPGSMCVGVNGGVLTTGSSGFAENKQSSVVTAVCPSERKFVNGAFTTKFSAQVFVNDASTTSNICCRSVIRDTNGSTAESADVCTSGTTGSGSTTLTTPQVTWSYTFAHYMVRCTVPAITGTSTSKIFTYRSIQE